MERHDDEKPPWDQESFDKWSQKWSNVWDCIICTNFAVEITLCKLRCDHFMKLKKAKVVDESDLIPKSMVPPVLKLLFKTLFAFIIFCLNLALGIAGFSLFTTLFSVLPNYKKAVLEIRTQNSSNDTSNTGIEPDLLTRPTAIVQICILLVPNFYNFLVGAYFLIFRHLKTGPVVSYGLLLSGIRNSHLGSQSRLIKFFS